MIDRRQFLLRTAAASSTAIVARSHLDTAIVPAELTVKSATPCDESTLRLGGIGDNFHMSWAADNKQYVSVCDGTGWPGSSKTLFNSQLFTISGQGPYDATFKAVTSYPSKSLWNVVSGATAPYYAFGTLALDGYIYQFLSTFGRNGFVGAKLVYSPDNGRTWHNQNSSEPVVWEPHAERSRKTMAFFEEPQAAFSLLSVLQMGQNYEDNRDGYIYVYAPNGNADGTMNELVMFRAPKTRLLKRESYEFFAGIRSNGSPTWKGDINARAPVHVFPRGWVNSKGAHPYAWHPSVVFNRGLGCYLMANWGMGCGPDGEWFYKPSYLGYWIARNPWGPWSQIFESTAWIPGNDPGARAYQPQIAPKWIAADGRSFWIVWTDFQYKEGFWSANKAASQAKTEAEYRKLAERMFSLQPYYGFNTQRVDLVLT